MDMKLSSIICASIVALSAFTLTAVGQVRQQFNVPPGVQAVKPNDTTLPERVNALQTQVNQLVAEVKSLQSQLPLLATNHSLDEANGKINKLNAALSAAQDAAKWVAQWGNAAVALMNDYTYGHVHQYCYHDPLKGGQMSCDLSEGPRKPN
jgi:peptidoglycan hydrolase CwlO-like protein